VAGTLFRKTAERGNGDLLACVVGARHAVTLLCRTQSMIKIIWLLASVAVVSVYHTARCNGDIERGSDFQHYFCRPQR
jgi:hypothetical protein